MRAPTPVGVLIDQVDVAALDPVDHVRRALADLVDPLGRHAHALDRFGRAAGGDDLKAAVVQALRDPRGAPALSESVTVMNAVPLLGSGTPAAACALANAVGKSRAIPITSPVERISGPSSASEPSKRSNGSTASLTETCSPKPSPSRSRGRSSSAIDSPSMIRQASLASGRPTALETNGTVREARGLASITYSSPACTAYWTLIRPTTPISSASSRVAARICSSISSPSECGGSTQALSPEWMPASSTCCMIPPIHASRPSHSASTSTSVGVLEEAVEEDLGLLPRQILGGADALALEVVGQAVARVDDLHRAPAEHVGGPHEQREADVAGAVQRLRDRARGRIRRRFVAEALEQRAEPAAVLGQVDRLHARAEQRHARRLQAGRELQRRLPAELQDQPLRLLGLDDRQHVLERERLEVQAVGGVVVGRDRLGVAVDHHRLHARVAHGHRGVHAAVVELDPLADAVGPGAEDHDRGALGPPPLPCSERLTSLRAARSQPE